MTCNSPFNWNKYSFTLKEFLFLLVSYVSGSEINYGRFYARKLHYFHSRYQKATVRVRKKSFFSRKLLFGDIKLSDLERRNRKLSAHDCTDHIKTLFFSDNYHETRNKNMSQDAMLLVPGHNCATSLVPVHKVHNVLTEQHGGLETFNLYWS